MTCHLNGLDAPDNLTSNASFKLDEFARLVQGIVIEVFTSESLTPANSWGIAVFIDLMKVALSVNERTWMEQVRRNLRIFLRFPDNWKMV